MAWYIFSSNCSRDFNNNALLNQYITIYRTVNGWNIWRNLFGNIRLFPFFKWNENQQFGHWFVCMQSVWQQQRLPFWVPQVHLTCCKKFNGQTLNLIDRFEHRNAYKVNDEDIKTRRQTQTTRLNFFILSFCQ